MTSCQMRTDCAPGFPSRRRVCPAIRSGALSAGLGKNWKQPCDVCRVCKTESSLFPPPASPPMALPPEAHLSELDRLDAQDVQVGRTCPTCSSLPPDPYAQAELERLREELVSAKARSTPRSQKRLAFSRFLTTCRLPGSPVKSTRSSWQQSSRAPSGNWPSCRCA